MTKTERYKLNQWESSDQVLMEDFNADNAAIDAALAEKAEQSELEVLREQVTAAQSAASAAQSTANGKANSSHTHTKSQITDFPTSMTPTSHAASGTTYGKGTDSNYGHLKLSDSTSSTSGVSGGIAATPKAVKAAYDLAASAAQPSYEIGMLLDYNGTDDLKVDLGRQPKMVMVGNRLGWNNTITTSSGNTFAGHAVAMPGYPGYKTTICSQAGDIVVLEVTKTGFTLHSGMAGGYSPYYYLALF